MKKQNDDRALILACLRENFEYRKLWDLMGVNLRAMRGHVNQDIMLIASFGTELKRIGASWWRGLDPTEDNNDILDILDPALQVDELSEEMAARIFKPEPGVKRVLTGKDGPFEGVQTINRFPWQMGPEDFDRNDRLLLVDMTRPKAQLLAEFEAYLDRFQREQTRRRAKAWRHLHVWRLRRKNKNPVTIARETGLSVDQVIHSYRSAFELTQGKPYDPQEWHVIRDSVHQGDLKRTCSTCPDWATCTETCPDVEPYADQDKVKLRELLR